jgi:hypothetical protein
MKRSGIITVMLLMLMVSGSGYLSAQRSMRGMMDSTRVNRPGNRMEFMQMRGMDHGMRRGMGHGPEFGMRRGMGRMPMDSVMGRMPMGLGRIMMGSIPNVTEKQKKEISDLMLKQQEEMKKFREETSAKMQSLRDSHRKNIMNLLTDEQKKFISSIPGY